MQIHVPKTVKGEIIRIGIRYNVDFSVLNINNFSLIQLSSLWLRDCSLSQDKKKKNKNEEGDNYLDEINEKLSCKGSKSTKRT